LGALIPPILLQIGQSSLYCLANNQTPIFETSPNPQFTIANQFNLTMPMLLRHPTRFN
jgi:hypothetical protein